MAAGDTTACSADGRRQFRRSGCCGASLIQTLYSIRSERQLVQHIDHNLLYRWFVGLNMDDKVWDHSTFLKNRDRLLNETVARAFFGKVLGLTMARTGLVRALLGRWHAD